ncbi:alcohol dehydrogenase catalytic domain-containing protein [Bacillus licheniformis]|nr:alcohol dehydrogenase catalytic domain-containing protein [Bacillus licheniformis]
MGKHWSASNGSEYAGRISRLLRKTAIFSYPRVLGHELSGEIVSIDNSGGTLKPGDQVSIIPYLECGACIACRNGRPNCCVNLNVLGVHTDGGMREYINVPADHLLKQKD